jgi:thiol:disulfide interchange protein DsbD
MVVIGFAAWVYDITRQSSGGRRHAGSALALLSLATALAGGHAALDNAAEGGATANAQDGSSSKVWEPFSPTRLAELRAQGKPVFLNFTAAWCITCLANERVALSSDTVTNAFKAQGITYLKGDWTNQDPAITKVLEDFGRSGVPLYLYYPPGPQSQAVVLPQILTPDTVLSALKDATSALSSNQP